ncbi:hypothetical protein L13192_03958 [Pyrenophora tritici-repentis]|uniref:Uncharacterized protein n=1 Tax=Pyrenophora tritici-repentis TaxID=45151 RepID=A0A922NI89_9PLEO|nr:hypothetical protein Ptr86124_006012 [Pyrenophora tritici-repentis]KAI1673099.1 hypothetical protein L13192_03958 [Pyrenophora tritici-repentis]KAI1677067.1 hypothetical protein KJE20_13156 [Pyrenophora tritici-repentis]
MARSQTDADWRHSETIDLTLSSPEPEPQARPQPRAPTRLTQTYISRDPRQYSISRVKYEPGQASGPAHVPVAPQRSRPINPDHLKAIISTTDKDDLQNVLLDLCKISPAFSGALVRGLTPHSAFARKMTKQHRVSTQVSGNYRVDNDSDSDGLLDEGQDNDQYEALQILARPPISASHRTGTPLQTQHYNLPLPPPHVHGSHSVPRIKREYNGSSGYGLHDNGSVQRAYQPTPPRPTALRSPLQNPSGSSPSVYRTASQVSSVQGPSGIRKMPEPAYETCVKCKEPFVGDAPCMYHPGKDYTRSDGSIGWECCDEDSPGCKFAKTHTTWEDLGKY